MRPRLEQLEDRTLPSNYSALTVSDLIADINAANAAGGTNTITLTAPTTSPYVLTAVDNTTDGANGLPVIAKKDILTIIGIGDTIERSAVSGTPDFRLFDVANGASLTLQSLTLQNGLAFGSGSSAEGGAIHNQGTLVLSGVTVQSNTAQGSGGASSQAGDDSSGGGIWSGSSLTLENGTLVQNNQAIGGFGGTPSNCTNHFKAGVGGNASGGGLYVAGGTANLTGVTVNNNIAQAGGGGELCNTIPPGFNGPGNAYGGGIYVAAGTVALASDTMDGNLADACPSVGEGYALGGGLYVAAGNVSLSADMVASNVARTVALYPLVAEGGGIYIASNATVTLCNDTVQSNTADGSCGGAIGGAVNSYGGGIYIQSGATVYIDNFTVAHTINNTVIPGLNASTANIDGTYILQNC
jgi:hypothetical protein